jgi:hypothetical protein
MAELKTKATDASVEKFIDGIGDEVAREDCRTLVSIMKRETKSDPRMWGSSIIGFGQYQYQYESGRGGDWFLAGFSPRKQNLVLYLMGGFSESPELMQKLGKHSTGRACLYIKRLQDVDVPTLTRLIRESVARAKQVSVPSSGAKKQPAKTTARRRTK